jgi:peroxiredoxin Q/BCP
MLATGSTAPDFKLPDEDGRERSLDELLGRGTLILYFYPADFTPGCTREACELRDLQSELRQQLASRGLRIVGVSPQDPSSHTRFRAEHDLPFTLLSDPDKQVIRAYDVDGPLGIGVRRVTYLIGADRKIIDAVGADLRIARHAEFVRRAILADEG